MTKKAKTFTERLLAAQESMGVVEAKGRRHGSKGGGTYIRLPDLLAKARPALRQQGLIITHGVRVEDGLLWVSTSIGDGTDVVAIDLPTLPESPGGRGNALTCHALGSSLTYLRRYGLACLLGCSDVPDDDGNAAEDAHRPQQRQPPERKQSDPEIAALWGHMKNAAKADGLTKTYRGGKVEGDWRALATKMGVDTPSDWRKVTAAMIRQILERREQRKIAAAELDAKGDNTEILF